MLNGITGVVRSALAAADIPAAARSGVIAVVAYTVVMEADRRLTGSRVDDLVLLGRPFVPNRPRLARPVGSVVHLLNGATIGIAYAALAHDRLPGPTWLRGAAALMIENAALYPLMRLGRRYHPAIRDGQLDDYWTWPAFAESIPPHLVYGLVVGPLYERIRTG